MFIPCGYFSLFILVEKHEKRSTTFIKLSITLQGLAELILSIVTAYRILKMEIYCEINMYEIHSLPEQRSCSVSIWVLSKTCAPAMTLLVLGLKYKKSNEKGSRQGDWGLGEFGSQISGSLDGSFTEKSWDRCCPYLAEKEIGLSRSLLINIEGDGSRKPVLNTQHVIGQ